MLIFILFYFCGSALCIFSWGRGPGQSPGGALRGARGQNLIFRGFGGWNLRQQPPAGLGGSHRPAAQQHGELSGGRWRKAGEHGAARPGPPLCVRFPEGQEASEELGWYLGCGWAAPLFSWLPKNCPNRDCWALGGGGRRGRERGSSGIMS